MGIPTKINNATFRVIVLFLLIHFNVDNIYSQFSLAPNGAAFSVMMFLPQIYEGFDLGYAYESPTSSRLSETGNKAHEIILRIKLGSRPDSKSGPQSTQQ